MYKFWKLNKDFKEKTENKQVVTSAEHLQKIVDAGLEFLKSKNSRWMDTKTNTADWLSTESWQTFWKYRKKVFIFLLCPQLLFFLTLKELTFF